MPDGKPVERSTCRGRFQVRGYVEIGAIIPRNFRALKQTHQLTLKVLNFFGPNSARQPDTIPVPSHNVSEARAP
jgi:hypothetical protein